MSALEKLSRNIGNPIRNELCRIAYRLLGGRWVVKPSQLASVQFLCSSRTEFVRTVDYGGELEALAAFLFLLRPEDVVWDIGASVGVFTLHSALRTQKVVSFEPDPKTFERLKENIKFNKFQDKVFAHGLALGKEQGRLELQTSGVQGFAPSLAKMGRHASSVMVEVSTIDELTNSGDFPKPTILKIDIEGAENDALLGGKIFLSGPQRPRLLFIEAHPDFLGAFDASMEILLTNLNQLGYQVMSTRKREGQLHLIAFHNSQTT